MHKFTYDIDYHIQKPTLVLSSVSHHHYGIITNVDPDSISFTFNMNSSQEGSFEVHKFMDGRECDLWDKIVSFKYVFVPEHGDPDEYGIIHGEYYNLEVTTVEGDDTIKQCTLTSASEFELSNKYVVSLEINTESDFNYQEHVTENDQIVSEYSLSTLCKFNDPNDPYAVDEDFSIVHRVLHDKCPDWTVKYCDGSVANEWGEFSISNQTVYDVFVNTLAKEFDCLFKFDSVHRYIYIYDLLNQCTVCGARGEFTDECPECHNLDKSKIKKGYGHDTSIFISYNNYSEKMTVDGDESNVKNCFYVTGGDDDMNAAIRNNNPTRSNYIYNFSAMDYDDMPEGLVTALNSYSDAIETVRPQYEEVVAKYYDALNNYYWYNYSMMPRTGLTRWQPDTYYTQDPTQFIYVKTLPSWAYLECSSAGTSGLVEFDATTVYEGQVIDDHGVQWTVRRVQYQQGTAADQQDIIATYLASHPIYFIGKLPGIPSERTANVQASTTINNSVRNIARNAVSSLFKIEIIDDDPANYYKPYVTTGNIWNGFIRITNTSDKEDTWVMRCENYMALVEVEGNNMSSLSEYMGYYHQMVETRIATDKNTYTSIFDIDDQNLFEAELKKYSLSRLVSFQNTYTDALSTLDANGIKPVNELEIYDHIYDDIYCPLQLKLLAITREIENPLVMRNGVPVPDESGRAALVRYYSNPDELDYIYGDEGLVEKYLDQMDQISKQLDMETYLNRINPNYWKIFHGYIRESSYNNSNYIAGDRADGEILNDAKKLLKIATEELKKASVLHYSLSDSLKNLLNTEEFAPFKDQFEIGDYLFCEADNKLYKLRLIQVKYDYGNPDSLSVTFSNVTKIEGYFSDVQSVLNQAQSMGSTYQTTVHQVSRNTGTTATIDDWMKDGLSTALVKIKNNIHEECTIDDGLGFMAKQKDLVTGDYNPKQIRITHNALAFTKDNWQTLSLALGEFYYKRYYEGQIRDFEGYGLISDFMSAGTIIGSQMIAGEIYSKNYSKTGNVYTGSWLDLDHGEIVLADGRIKWDNSNLSIDGDITARSLTLAPSVEIDATTNISNLATVATSGQAADLTDISDYAKMTDIPPETSVTHTTTNGVTTTTVTTSSGSYTVYSASTSDGCMVYDWGAGTQDTSTHSNNYFKVSKQGLLTADNAVIYGTIYATNGKFHGRLEATEGYFTGELRAATGSFSGAITASSGQIGNWHIISGGLYDGSSTSASTRVTTSQIGVGSNYLSSNGIHANYIEMYGTINMQQNTIAGLYTLNVREALYEQNNRVLTTSSYFDYNLYNVGTPKIKGGTSGDGGMEIGAYIDFHNRGSGRDKDGRIQINGAGTGWNISPSIGSGSSYKIKKNIEELSQEEAEKILLLKPVKFDYKYFDTNTQNDRGFIAEEVAKILPNLVIPEEGEETDENFFPASIKYFDIIPYLVKVVQRQDDEIKTLTEKINKLKGGGKIG